MPLLSTPVQMFWEALLSCDPPLDAVHEVQKVIVELVTLSEVSLRADESELFVKVRKPAVGGSCVWLVAADVGGSLVWYSLFATCASDIWGVLGTGLQTAFQQLALPSLTVVQARRLVGLLTMFVEKLENVEDVRTHGQVKDAHPVEVIVTVYCQDDGTADVLDTTKPVVRPWQCPTLVGCTVCAVLWAVQFCVSLWLCFSSMFLCACARTAHRQGRRQGVLARHVCWRRGCAGVPPRARRVCTDHPGRGYCGVCKTPQKVLHV